MAKIKDKAAMAARKKTRKKNDAKILIIGDSRVGLLAARQAASQGTAIIVHKNRKGLIGVGSFIKATSIQLLSIKSTNKCSADEAYMNTLVDMKYMQEDGYKHVDVNSYTQVKEALRIACNAESFYGLETLRHCLEGRIISLLEPSKKLETIYESITFCIMRLKQGRISWWNIKSFLNNHYPLYINEYETIY